MSARHEHGLATKVAGTKLVMSHNALCTWTFLMRRLPLEWPYFLTDGGFGLRR
jgi:hypothetical protein